MSLPTPSRFDEAKRLLESLDLNSLTRELSKPSRKLRPIREQFSDLEKSLSLSSVANMKPLPLHVTLSSLVAQTPGFPVANPVQVEKLFAEPQDHMSRVRHLCNNLAIIFAAAGLYNPVLNRASKRTDSGILNDDLGSSFIGVPLINMHYLRSLEAVPSPYEPGAFDLKSLTFDPRDLIHTFKDFIWAEDIRLDRLSICPLGLPKLIQRAGLDAQLPESYSVPLF